MRGIGGSLNYLSISRGLKQSPFADVATILSQESRHGMPEVVGSIDHEPTWIGLAVQQDSI